MIERPALMTSEDGRLTVIGTLRSDKGSRSTFWGLVLLASIALLLLWDTHRWSYEADLWDYVLPITGGVVGASLVRHGRAAQRAVTQPLLRISADRHRVATLDA